MCQQNHDMHHSYFIYQYKSQHACLLDYILHKAMFCLDQVDCLSFHYFQRHFIKTCLPGCISR